MSGFSMRVATLSELPEDHKVFAENHKGAIHAETHIDMPNTKEGMSHKTVKQMVWRKNVVKGTWGAKLVDGLQESDFDLVLRRNGHADIFM